MLFLTLLKQDLLTTIRHASELLVLLIFALLSVLLFPLALGPDVTTLQAIAPGLIWVIVLLLVHLHVPQVWRQDRLDGTLEHLHLRRIPNEWVYLSKVVSVWGLLALGLLLMVPLMGMVYGLDGFILYRLIMVFCIASLPLSFLAVTGGLMSQEGVSSALMSLVVLLPSYVPLLIFGSSAITNDAAMMFFIGLAMAFCPMLLYIGVWLLSEEVFSL